MITSDTEKDLARAIMRGEFDLSLNDVTPHARPHAATPLLEKAAKDNNILKIDGQRGITELGGLSLIGLLGASLNDLPSFEEIAAK